MYQVYLRDILLPVTPSEIVVNINSKNETVDLINDGQVNILKEKGLDDIKMTFMLPNVDYPFSAGVDDSTRANYYLERFKKFKTDKEAFNLVILRYFPNGKSIFSTNIKVTLEDYSYTESAENGFDIECTIELKEYKEYATQKITLSTSSTGQTTAVVSNVRETTASTPSSYTVKKGDTLWAIAKQYLGDGSKYTVLAKLNSITNPNFITIGQVIKLS